MTFRYESASSYASNRGAPIAPDHRAEDAAPEVRAAQARHVAGNLQTWRSAFDEAHAAIAAADTPESHAAALARATAALTSLRDVAAHAREHPLTAQEKIRALDAVVAYTGLTPMAGGVMKAVSATGETPSITGNGTVFLELDRQFCRDVLTYFKHRLTNAGSEAINSVVQMLKKRAFGYRSFANFRTAILFHCGGLDLYPLESGCHPKAG